MESEYLLKVIELLSVQQINTHEANDNTENFITVKETVKTRKSNWAINRIPEFHWRIHLKFVPLKNARINRTQLWGKLNVTFIWSYTK